MKFYMNIINEVNRMSNEYDVSSVLILNYLDLIMDILYNYFSENEIDIEEIVGCLEKLVSERSSIEFSVNCLKKEYDEEPKAYTLTQSLLKNILESFELDFEDKNIDIAILEKEYTFMR